MATTKAKTKAKAASSSLTTAATTAPWETKGTDRRFAGHTIVLAGKLAFLRKKDVAEVLAQEGAKVADALSKDTTIFVYATPAPADQKRAEKMKSEGASLFVVSEDEFRKRFLLPSPAQAVEMLAKKKGAERLANLLELNRKEYSRSTDEYSIVPLKKQSFQGATITSVSLCGLHFIECDLRKANLTKTKWISGASKSDFRDVVAKDTELVEVSDCDFSGATLQETSIRDLTGCRFDKADLTKGHALGDFTKCSFNGATLDNFKASYGKIKDCSFEKASLKKVELDKVTFTNTSFAGADFQGATLKADDDNPLLFKKCNFRQADFRKANLSHVRFEECDLTGAQFEGAKLSKLDLVKTDGSKAKGLDTGATDKANAKGPAYAALEAAAPTFKNITVKVNLKKGAKKLECTLYQFDHSSNSSCRQAWLNDDNVGSLTIPDAIATIARLNPGATLDAKSLRVNGTKGKSVKPSLKLKGLEQAVLAAWNEALRT